MVETMKESLKEWAIYVALTVWEFLKGFFKRYKVYIFCFVVGLILGWTLKGGSIAKIRAEAQEETARIIAEDRAAKEAEELGTLAQFKTMHDDEIIEVCKVLSGIEAYNIGNNAKIAIFDVIRNRADCNYDIFGAEGLDNIIAICQQENQWQGYSPKNHYSAEDYNLILNHWHENGEARTIPSNMYWVKVEQGQITVRDKWEGGNQRVIDD